MPRQIHSSLFPKSEKVSDEQRHSPSRRSKAPTTQSFGDATVKENDNVSLSDADQFLFRNLRSSYRNECEEEMKKIGEKASLGFAPRSSRVLVIEKARSSSASPTRTAEEFGDDFITILTYSQSPYEDFRRSMQEMVEARLECKGEVDREFMEELFFRYLNLNNDKFYGFIVRAFLDLIVISPVNSGRIPLRRRSSVRSKLKLGIKRMHKFCHK